MPDNKATYLDNFCDTLMLSSAIYNGSESCINKTVNIFRYNSKNYISPVKSLSDTLSEEENSLVKEEYNRYWHGCLFIFKTFIINI